MPGTKAKESQEIKKLRKKLEKQISKEKPLFNPEKLAQIKNSIHKWIERHSKERIDLKEKTIKLFDENQHPAKTQSKFVHQLFQQLEEQAKKERKPFNARDLR